MKDLPGRGDVSLSSLAELDALFEDRSRWDDVDPDRLRHLLFYRCLSYGLDPAESSIPSLMALQRVAAERLHPAVRREIAVHLGRAIERVHREHHIREGAGCTNALLPFLLEDPDPSVVSTAATEMAQLLPLEAGDPLTGPRYVRSLFDQVNGEDARAGLLAGVLQLGDARVGALLEGGWQQLSVEGRQTLALLIQSFHGLTTLTVRFLLSWLDDEVKAAASATFGMVAATLARAGRHAAEHGADEVERVFPASDAPTSGPVGGIRHLSFDECRLSIEERLVRAGWSEAPPRMMPHVLSYWGFDEEAYRLAVAGGVATVLRRGEAGEDAGPVRLELVPEWPDDPRQETLVEWGIFNPLGPTINTLRLTRVPAGAALVYTVYHPNDSGSRVVAVLREPIDASAVNGAVARVLASNGTRGLWLVRSLPDYVHLPAESTLTLREVADTFAAARDAAERAGEEAVELGWHAARLQALARDPWGVAAREIEQSAANSTQVSRGDATDIATHRREMALQDVDAYVQWLTVAAAPDHVASVRSQVPVAWQRLVDRPDDEAAGEGRTDETGGM